VTNISKSPNKGRTRLVERTFDVLFALSDMPEGCGLVDLARYAGLSGATALRIVRTLVDMNAVSFNDRTKQYNLGPAMRRFAAASFGRTHLISTAQESLERLRDETQETICIFQRSRHDRVCVAAAKCSRELSFHIEPGQRRSMFRGSPGKLLLAHMSQQDRVLLYKRGKISERERQTIEAECKQILAAGMAFSRDELVVGGAALVAPIFSHTGEVSALTILGPSARLDGARMGLLQPKLKRAAAQISERLDWQDKRSDTHKVTPAGATDRNTGMIGRRPTKTSSPASKKAKEH
jgi:DNA-binding IclR family transcriptional regulator